MGGMNETGGHCAYICKSLEASGPRGYRQENGSRDVLDPAIEKH